ncbi:MAG TPA: Gfo/Idh/MocA family oxidoreductase [Fimbriimonadaceae bacterium]|nr:Gfo/Idh/MocA family oxidoreductase [Fimbriimonadaceae bacterium]
MNKVGVGIIGCGNISGIYIENIQASPQLELVGVADINLERARSVAERTGTAALTVDEMLANPAVGIIVNLTVPKAHYEVASAIVTAGKSVYIEKPLSNTRADGKELLAQAKANGVLVGCAPDTFLGHGIQTAKRVISSGRLGKVVGVSANMMCHGHESWHPAPEFYYEVGGGPLFDMGPYYLTALVELLGPVRRVQGSARVSFAQRVITSEPQKGKVIEVETPTHIAGILDFASGAVGQITMSFDVWRHDMPHIEIYGEEGTMRVPDPNGFGGDVVLTQGVGDFEVVQDDGTEPKQNARGIGVEFMASGQHRATGALAYHVLDVMQAVLEATDQGVSISIDSDPFHR